MAYYVAQFDENTLLSGPDDQETRVPFSPDSLKFENVHCAAVRAEVLQRRGIKDIHPHSVFCESGTFVDSNWAVERVWDHMPELISGNTSDAGYRNALKHLGASAEEIDMVFSK